MKAQLEAMQADIKTNLNDISISFKQTDIKNTHGELSVTDFLQDGTKKSIELAFKLKGLNVSTEGLSAFLTIDELLINTYNPRFTNKPTKISITDGVYYFRNEDEAEVEIENDETIISKTYRIILEIL